MADTSLTSNSMMKESMLDLQKKIQKIRSAKTLVENKYLYAKQCALEVLNTVRMEIFDDLDEILKLKLNFFEDMEKKLEENLQLSTLVDNCKNNPESESIISRMMISESLDSKLMSHLSLEFISENLYEARFLLGYIKSSPIKPEDLSLHVNNEKLFAVGSELEVCAKGEKPWYVLVKRSLSGYAIDANGKKILPNITDNYDGSYIFRFRLDNYSSYQIQITLYGRHIKNSPVIVEIEPNESKKQKSKSMKSDYRKLKDIQMEDKNMFEKWENSINCQIEKKCYSLVEKPVSTKTLYNDKEMDNLSSQMDKNIDPSDEFWADYSMDKNKNESDKDELDDNIQVRKLSSRMHENMKITHENRDIENPHYYFEESNEMIPHEANKLLEDEPDSQNEESFVSVSAHLINTIDKNNGINLEFPIGVAVNHNNDMIICDTGHNVVWIADEFGKPKMKIDKISEGINFVRPSAVVILKDGNFVVKDHNGIHLYNHNGIFIRSIGENVLNRPYGLAVTEDETIITLNETREPNLFLFSKDGQIVNNNTFEPLVHKPQNSKCRFMAYFSNQVVVSDLGLNMIYKTTVDGKSIKKFGCYGKIPGAMNEPSGITLDPKGTMLIGDSRNNRVQIFDWEGDYLGLVKFSKPIHRPSGITLTKDGHLYVLNYLNHSLAIYRLKIEE